MEKKVMEQWALYYPEKQVTEPVIYELGARFNLVTNIFHYNILGPDPTQKILLDTPDRYRATAVIEVSGTESDIAKAKEFLKSKGIKYEAHRI